MVKLMTVEDVMHECGCGRKVATRLMNMCGCLLPRTKGQKYLVKREAFYEWLKENK